MQMTACKEPPSIVLKAAQDTEEFRIWNIFIVI